MSKENAGLKASTKNGNFMPKFSPAKQTCQNQLVGFPFSEQIVRSTYRNCGNWLKNERLQYRKEGAYPYLDVFYFKSCFGTRRSCSIFCSFLKGRKFKQPNQ